MPLLRYRTGDIASLNREPCACGRTFARMSAIRGRRDDMLIVRGVNLYPSQIEHVLLGVEGVAPHYQLVVERPAQLDEITVLCEGEGDDLADRVRARDPRADRRRRRASTSARRRDPPQRGQSRPRRSTEGVRPFRFRGAARGSGAWR